MADLSKIQIKQQGKASQIKPKQFGSTVGGEKKPVTLNFSTKQSSFSAPLKGSALTASLEKAGDKKQDPSVTETKTEAAGAKTDNYALHNTLKTRLNRLDSSLFSAQRGGGITAGAGDSLHFYSSQSTASASNIKQAQSYIGQATSYKKEADKCMAKGDYDGAIAAYKKAENSLKQAQRQVLGSSDKESTALQQQISVLRTQYSGTRESLQTKKTMNNITSGVNVSGCSCGSSNSSFDWQGLAGVFGSSVSLLKTINGVMGSTGSGSGVGGLNPGSTLSSSSLASSFKSLFTSSSTASAKETIKIPSGADSIPGVKAQKDEFDAAVRDQGIDNAEIAKLTQKLSGLEAKKADLEAKINNIDSSLSVYKNAANTVAQKEATLTTKEKEQAGYLATVESQDKLVKYNEGKIQDLASPIAQASKAVSDSESNVAQTKAEYENYEKNGKPKEPAADADQATKDQYQRDLGSYQAKLKELKDKWTAAENKLKEDKAKLAALITQRDNYTKAMETAQAEQSAAQDKADGYNKEIETLKREIEEAKKPLEQKEGEASNSAQKEIAGWVKELETTNDEIVETTRLIEVSKQDIQTSETKKKTAQANADALIEAKKDPKDFVEDHPVDEQMRYYYALKEYANRTTPGHFHGSYPYENIEDYLD